MNTDDFYKNLPSFTKFTDIAKFEDYVPVPSDWSVVITDVKGSTQAVAEGRYKEVNAVGVASIIAVLNAAGKIDIPFVFGGDGATLLIPPSIIEGTKGALVAARALAKKYFNLELRVGIVPITVIPDQYRVLISKFKASSHYHQAMFTGDGLIAAEKLVKGAETASIYALPMELKPDGRFGGFECRWNDIESTRGETVSYLIKATSKDLAEAAQVYREVMEKVEACYGNEADYHPVTVEGLHLITETPRLNTETHIRAGDKNWLGRFWYRTKILLTDIYFNWAMKTSRTNNDFNLMIYKNLLVATCDYRKFDDTLRMVISGTKEARVNVIALLEKLHQEDKLVYGIDIATSSRMTCLVFERYGKQVHFIDGANGGYTMASRGFKAQLKALYPVRDSEALTG